MEENIHIDFPLTYQAIQEKTRVSGFSMASDVLTGSLLRTLAASKPASNFLELGTGTGLSTSWILDGMDEKSTLISIDNDDAFLSIAREYLGSDSRLELVNSDGEDWVMSHLSLRYDFIFADTWHGKYLLLDEVLNMLNPGGMYVIDDMIEQANWPLGHREKAEKLIQELENRKDLKMTNLVWSTGIIICVKK
ncbi:methyltransferase domain-containing protein [Cytophagaceae bacterium 50C-KIRBA]|uniref:Methyltransferase domain-containing protein n=2 Tax=Aquirufa beregesia TaxID=2516556 RepID=A0ABX0EUB8_9BACT|nr:class I SAM-dependent methyltransferase [Aquirufa beregesia]NGZ43651.1 methyltransferase domain-containing protein [Aquirufa beregesia]